jgi:hypothetical protein
VLKVIAGSLVKSILHMYSHVNVCIARIAIARQATGVDVAANSLDSRDSRFLISISL